MQLRTPSPEIFDGEFPVSLAGTAPHAVIELDQYGETLITVETPADAERLIRAAALAKDMILRAQAVLMPVDTTIIANAIRNGTTVIVTFDGCPARSPDDILCELAEDHDGPHRAPGAGEGDPDVTWAGQDAAAGIPS